MTTNVILIVFDTARADAFEPYGARAGATPAIAELARRGAAHPQAFADASWTVPSHAAMLSGRLPRSAGFQHRGDTKAASCTTCSGTASMRTCSPTDSMCARGRRSVLRAFVPIPPVGKRPERVSSSCCVGRMIANPSCRTVRFDYQASIRAKSR
jgi:sulfatase-like protein